MKKRFFPVGRSYNSDLGAKMDYRMIFSDIDGTLLDGDNALPLQTRDAVLRLQARGVLFVLASARSPKAMLPVMEALGAPAPIISMGGSLILDENGKLLRNIGMPVSLAIAIKTEVETRWPQVCCTAYHGAVWLVDDPGLDWIRAESQITGALPHRADLPALPKDAAINKLLCVGDPGQLDEIQARLGSRCPELAVHKSWESYLEIQDAGATKGSAVEFLCARYGIALSQTIAFGDNYNDLDMLQAVGLGFAMGNAGEEIQRLVGRVTLSNDQNGVLAVLRQLEEGTLTTETGLLHCPT